MKYVVILKGHNILNRFIFNIIRIIVWNLCCDRNCTIYFCSFFLEIINLSFYVFSIYFVLVFFKSYKEIDFNVHTKLIFHFIKIVDRFLTAEGWKVALNYCLPLYCLLDTKTINILWCNITVNNLFIWWRLCSYFLLLVYFS